ncbi:MAG: DUF4271 domain-containing protein [Flavobacteriales bacterium]
MTELIPIEREVLRLYEPWMGFVFIGVLMAVAVIRRQFPAYVQMMGWNFSNYRIVRQTLEEGEFSQRADWLVMLPVALSSFALFAYLVLAEWSRTGHGTALGLFGKLFTMLLCVYGLKLIAVNLVRTLTAPMRALANYIGNTFLLLNTLALPLLLLSLAAALSSGSLTRMVLVGGLVLVAAAYLLRVLRGVQAALNERIPLYYIILYLCTLEFLPSAVLIKAWMELHPA